MISEISSKSLLTDNILILGKGYIGTNLNIHLKTKYNVLIKSREELDYLDENTLTKFLTTNNIKYLINCFGFTGRPNVDEGEVKKKLCWELNTFNPLGIVNICNRSGVRYIHISSGCIYDGYDKSFTENDSPNFGLFDNSSTYSKTKHAFEILSKNLDLKILRLRMPMCNDLTNPRNYLKKIMDYPNLIDMLNSKTYIPDLCGFVESLIQSDVSWEGQDIYNIVNQNPLPISKIIESLIDSNEGNWSDILPKTWVKLSDLKITAPRSNCSLDNTKASKFYSFNTEEQVLNMIINYNNGNQTA